MRFMIGDLVLYLYIGVLVEVGRMLGRVGSGCVCMYDMDICWDGWALVGWFVGLVV